MAAVCVLCLVPISVLLIQASLKRRKRNNAASEWQNASSETKLTDSLPAEKYNRTSMTER
jgi:hypothetical protein